MSWMIERMARGETTHFVQDIDLSDAAIGAIVLGGDHNWKQAGRLKRLWVRLVGKRVVIDHLGLRSHVAWFRGQPFLIDVEEVV